MEKVKPWGMPTFRSPEEVEKTKKKQPGRKEKQEYHIEENNV